tara:strand:- start:136 stop:822 length:687 start_codon:yes stop_codon:yes gene_type:complete
MNLDTNTNIDIDVNTYNKKLENLYMLIITKLNNNNILNQNIQNINKRLDNIESKINTITNHNINKIDNSILNLQKQTEQTIFYLNLLYIKYFNKKSKNIDSFLFDTKLTTLCNNYNINYNTSIYKGTLYLNFDNIINIKVNQTFDNISYIILSFYTKKVLIKNYNFNYIIKLKKINNEYYQILPVLDYNTFFKDYISKLQLKQLNPKKNLSIHISFYSIDYLNNIINN